MSIRSWRYAIWRLLEDLYYFARTGERWHEVSYSAWKVWHETTTPARAIGQFFFRIWKYRNILWNDADWDHGYLLTLLEFKFLNMMKYHRDNGHTMDSDKIALELAGCAEICRRVHTDNYCETEHAAHEEKWGRAKFETLPAEEYGRDKLGEPKMYTLNIGHVNATTPELKEQEREEFRAIMRLEDERKQEDLNRLGELISAKLSGWWD
jgi:hypothetical protein